jgi:hypothetical protein
LQRFFDPQDPPLSSVREHFSKRRPGMSGLPLGVIPGSVVKLAQKHPSFVLEIGEKMLALDEEIVREIYVKKVLESDF